ncbi:hypothetical protein SKAU_G00150220 [Synaphobranchus kaupii]|uniref:Uncharacterized protein n=1 Tax=Synaphobranchus kaupii TaxID=118154 RepID=A0A9Q1FTW9_SYNKA|nr:hypothetical protein SKAU_G00150220 [Synaphobranchus kaupii]
MRRGPIQNCSEPGCDKRTPPMPTGGVVLYVWPVLCFKHKVSTRSGHHTGVHIEKSTSNQSGAGIERRKTGKKQHKVHPKLLRFLSELNDFENLWKL